MLSPKSRGLLSGTGMVADAGGTLTGTVRAAGRRSQVKLTGILTLDP